MINSKGMERKKKRKIHTWLRRGIQLFFFLAFPSVFTAAFSGVKYIFTQLGTGEAVTFTSFLSVLIAICLYTILFGRFFCGYACAFGSLGDAIHGAFEAFFKKRKKKLPVIGEKLSAGLNYLKYIILAAIVLLCFAGVYGKFQGTSPWDVFSMLRSLHPKWTGYLVGWVLLILIMIGMAVKERFFCRYLCPMGAVFSLLPVLPFFSLHRDRNSCIRGCGACTKSCPSGVELPDDGSIAVSGDCFQCGKCIDICPKENIHTGIHKLKGNEIWYVVVRAVILASLCFILGV